MIFPGLQTLPQAIQNKVDECNATLYVADRDYFYQYTDDGQSWMFASSGTTLKLPTGTLALENISTAVAAILVSGLTVTQEAIAQGIRQARLQGRFEIRQIQGKTVIFDAGHNPHGVDFLLNQLRKFLEYNKQYTEVISVFSMLADKDINSVAELLKDTVLIWKIAPLTVPRAAKIEQLDEALQGETVQHFESVQLAFKSALNETKNNQLILVCGSFHTLEAVWEYLEECQ